jgi:hypothetical protein
MLQNRALVNEVGCCEFVCDMAPMWKLLSLAAI